MTSQSIQVLVFASNDKDRSVLRDFLLEKAGLNLAAEATNSEEALQGLKTNHVDVALLELEAQNTDGIELTREIRKSHPTVRVLISTDGKTPEGIFALMDAGADGYVLKGNSVGLEKGHKHRKTWRRLARSRYCCPGVGGNGVSAPFDTGLTDRNDDPPSDARRESAVERSRDQ